jgi:hypothetical protein
VTDKPARVLSTFPPSTRLLGWLAGKFGHLRLMELECRRICLPAVLRSRESIMKTKGQFSVRQIDARLWVLAAVAVLFSLTPLAGTLVKTSKHQGFTTGAVHPRHPPAVVPVSFHASELTIPAELDKVYSYRRMDEFLQHQVWLTAGARDNGPDDDEIQIF